MQRFYAPQAVERAGSVLMSHSFFRRAVNLSLGNHARETDLKDPGDPLERLDTRVLPAPFEEAVEQAIDIARLRDIPLQQSRLQAAAAYHGAEALHQQTRPNVLLTFRHSCHHVHSTKVSKRTPPFGDIRLSFNHLRPASFTVNETATNTMNFGDNFDGHPGFPLPN